MSGLFVAATLCAAATSCGSEGGGGGGNGPVGTGGADGTCETGGAGGSGGILSGPPTITIKDFTFSPNNLNVVPGVTVTVDNEDAAPHSATSESTVGEFMPSAVDGVSFDTGAFPKGTKTFIIPWNASPGTVVHYFCTVHRAQMVGDAEPTVTIVAAP